MKIVPFAYLASYLLSLLGNSIAGVALPLIVLQTTGSALGAGTVSAATAIPAVLAGLLMGVVIDRINRRTSSVVTDLISAASIAALPIVDMISGLNLGWFIFFGIVGSLGDIPGATARETLLPAVVRAAGVSADRMMGMREALGAVALILGPATAGLLMSIFDGSAVLWITAATSLAAALITMLIPHRIGTIVGAQGQSVRPSGTTWTQLREGWRVLFRHRFLLAVTGLNLVSVTILASLQALILPVFFTREGAPGALGFVLTALAVGMLVGGGAYAVVGSRVPRRVWFLAGLLGTALGFGIVASLASIGTVLVGSVVVGASSGLFGSLLGVLMIERVPEELRGRILGTQNAILTAAPPVGIMVAGVVTEFAGVNAAAIGAASIWVVAVIIGVSARSLRNLESSGGAAEGGVPEGGTADGGEAAPAAAVDADGAAYVEGDADAQQ